MERSQASTFDASGAGRREKPLISKCRWQLKETASGFELKIDGL
jgi:hypothetical protein